MGNSGKLTGAANVGSKRQREKGRDPGLECDGEHVTVAQDGTVVHYADTSDCARGGVRREQLYAGWGRT